MDRESLERLLGEGRSAEQIAKLFGKNTSTVSHWMTTYALTSARREKHLAKGGIEREQLEELMERRMSIAQIAVEVGLSKTGVRHWLRRWSKANLVDQAGGRCVICGYDRYVGALEFHHLDRTSKRLTLSSNGAALSLDVLRSQARKSALLCSNCHAEVEAGLAVLPLEFAVSANKVDTP